MVGILRQLTIITCLPNSKKIDDISKYAPGALKKTCVLPPPLTCCHHACASEPCSRLQCYRTRCACASARALAAECGPERRCCRLRMPMSAPCVCLTAPRHTTAHRACMRAARVCLRRVAHIHTRLSATKGTRSCIRSTTLPLPLLRPQC